MAVTVDATGTVFSASASPATSSSSITVGAAATALLIIAQCDNAAAVITAPTWNGVSSTLIGHVFSADQTCSSSLYGLLNPAAGAKTLSLTYTGAANFDICAISFNGTTTASVAAAFANFVSQANNTAGTSSTVTVSSAVGDIAVAAGIGGASNPTLNQTSIYATTATAAARAAGAASVVFNGSFGSSQVNVLCGCDIVAPGGASFIAAPNPPILQAVKRAAYW